MRPSLLRALATLVLAAVIVVTLLAAAGCGTGQADAAETPYCVDAQGQVYPPSYCDGGNPLFWYWLGAWSHPYSYGQRISVTNVHITRIDSTDRSARTRYGMPATGRVSSGFRYSPPRSSTSRPGTSGTRPGRTSGFGSVFRRSTTGGGGFGRISGGRR